MKEFKLKLLQERDELEDKITELGEFMYTESYDKLDDVNKTLLSVQLDYMTGYAWALKERIDRIITNKELEEYIQKYIENGNKNNSKEGQAFI